MKDKIIVALDTDKVGALKIAQELKAEATWLKVGMTLFYQEGPPIIEELKSLGFKIFLDLKLFDIPNQVKGAAKALTQLGVDMFTVHASGGAKMMKAATYGVNEALDADATLKTVPMILGVSVLTSFSEEALGEVGVGDGVQNQVITLANLAVKSGLDGLVSSPQELKAVRVAVGDSLKLVTPGIRPASAAADDQARIATPNEAFNDGADFIVVGRPVTEACDPKEAFLQLLG